MENLRVGMLCLTFWFLFPRTSWAEEFLYLPITRTPVITSGFCGYRTATGACHGGIDYDVRDDGDGIIAAAAGTVEVTEDGWSNTYRGRRVYGNYIQVLHDNGYRTIYGHLKRGTLLVRVGDHVRIGATLGVGDNSGWSTGSHLHFEVRDASNRKVDPYGDSPSYPNCGANSLWVNCPPISSADVDRDGDGFSMLSDCDDENADAHPFGTERCNGRDDDCDTIFDNWAALGVACTVEPAVGCIRNGTWVCSSDETTIVCNADSEIHDELCNGRDDDCNGRTDEPWRTGLSVDLDEPCEAGLGECRRSGVWECEPFGRGVVCGVEIVSGTPEVCDGLDNDCDGSADDYCTLEEWATVYCCDGRTYGQDSVCVQIEEPSSLYVRWDVDTCELSSGSTRAGGACSVSSQCVIYDFSGVCRLSCASHAGLCLHDTMFSYCTKQCTSDAECPAGGRCRLTVTIDSPDVRLCRYGY